jgi:F-type H+-transporting ATPase subunit b
MLVDWFTVIAQLVNFLILIWLLKRFLYKPVLNAITARERDIEARLQAAHDLQSTARMQLDSYERKNAELDRRRESLLQQAGVDAEAERTRLLEQARQEASELRRKQAAALREEGELLQNSIVERIQQEVLSIARKALADLADVDIDQRIVDRFIARLRSLSAEERAQLRAQLQRGEHGAVVRSAFPMQAAQRASLETSLLQVLGIAAPIEFNVAPDLVGGIELLANGYKVEWTLASFLSGLQTRLLWRVEPPSVPSGASGPAVVP